MFSLPSPNTSFNCKMAEWKVVPERRSRFLIPWTVSACLLSQQFVALSGFPLDAPNFPISQNLYNVTKGWVKY